MKEKDWPRLARTGVIFATLGYMSQAVGKPIGEVVTKSIGLAFVAYPEAINKLPAMQPLFGVIFFLALALAGLSSAISLTEAFVAAQLRGIVGIEISVTELTGKWKVSQNRQEADRHGVHAGLTADGDEAMAGLVSRYGGLADPTGGAE